MLYLSQETSKKIPLNFNKKIMEAFKIKTSTIEENTSDTPIENNIEGKISSYRPYRIRQNDEPKNLTLIYDLISNGVLTDIPEEYLLEILKGKSYLKKTVTTEYFIINNDGENLTKKLNDNYIKYITSEDISDFPDEKNFIIGEIKL